MPESSGAIETHNSGFHGDALEAANFAEDNVVDADSASDAGSVVESDVTESSTGDAAKLGSFFEKKKRKVKLRETGRRQPSSAQVSIGAEDEENAIDDATVIVAADDNAGDSGLASNVETETVLESPPIKLGSFFDPPRRRKKILVGSGRSNASSCSSPRKEEPEEVPLVASCLPAGTPKQERIPDRPAHTLIFGAASGSACSSRSWPQPPVGLRDMQEAPPSRAASNAASRAAWIRRGEGGNDNGGDSTQRSSSSVDADELEAEEFAMPTASRSSSSSAGATRARTSTRSRSGCSLTGAGRRKSLTGLCQGIQHSAVDSTRCHWLLSPESLLIRVDPETSAFLQQQWLALAQIKTRSSSSTQSRNTDRGRGEKKRSYPARLHAGWLAQVLRPRGWLSSIPEDEQRNLPFPVDLVSEPDRGARRPSVCALGREILRELGDTSGQPMSTGESADGFPTEPPIDMI